MKNKFYITTAIAYTNAGPHLGHALEFIQGDVLARYHRAKGDDTWFLTGTDEHGTKIARTAENNHKEPQQFVDEIVPKYESLLKLLSVTNDDFIRTSDRTRHWPAAQKIWELLVDNGDLYKKNYEGYYCVGHEAFVKKSDLVDGLCPLHKTEPETVVEENWFFRLSKYTKEIKTRIESDQLKILPVSKKNEIINLLDDAEDISFSRPSKDLKWGIPVPNDPTQTMYVWADALTNYISALGWDHNGEDFQKFWPADVHLIGKDILRFHAMIWPAMLLSAGLDLPKAIYVHGFVNIDGQKMSKTIGNVVDPIDMINKYGTEVFRYFLLREIPSDEDGDFSEKRLVERYNSDLANGLGNLVQRVVTLLERGFPAGEIEYKKLADIDLDNEEFIKSFQFHKALGAVWTLIDKANVDFNSSTPWKSIEENPELFRETMMKTLQMINLIGYSLVPFMPETSQKIQDIFGFPDSKEISEGYNLKIKKGVGLFPRL